MATSTPGSPRGPRMRARRRARAPAVDDASAGAATPGGGCSCSRRWRSTPCSCSTRSSGRSGTASPAGTAPRAAKTSSGSTTTTRLLNDERDVDRAVPQPRSGRCSARSRRSSSASSLAVLLWEQPRAAAVPRRSTSCPFILPAVVIATDLGLDLQPASGLLNAGLSASASDLRPAAGWATRTRRSTRCSSRRSGPHFGFVVVVLLAGAAEPQHRASSTRPRSTARTGGSGSGT